MTEPTPKKRLRARLQPAFSLLAGALSWAALAWVLWGADPSAPLFFGFLGLGALFGVVGFFADPNGRAAPRWTSLGSLALVASAATLAWLLCSSAGG